jgi:DNA-binding NtrC family response regulator
MTNESKKTVLIVDDDFDLLKQYEMQFASAGFNVVTADCQEDAEKVIKNIKPDLVVSDLMMENIDGGFSLSYHIKKKYPDVPVLIITGVTRDIGLQFSTNSDEGRRWIKADAILNKPIKLEDLLKEVNKYL